MNTITSKAVLIKLVALLTRGTSCTKLANFQTTLLVPPMFCFSKILGSLMTVEQAIIAAARLS